MNQPKPSDETIGVEWTLDDFVIDLANYWYEEDKYTPNHRWAECEAEAKAAIEAYIAKNYVSKADLAEALKDEPGKLIIDIGSEFACPRDYRRAGRNSAFRDLRHQFGLERE